MELPDGRLRHIAITILSLPPLRRALLHVRWLAPRTTAHLLDLALALASDQQPVAASKGPRAFEAYWHSRAICLPVAL